MYIQPTKKLYGEITVPGDKSISHRAVMIGAISNGTTVIENFLHAADPISTLNCINALGIQTHFEKNILYIEGNGLYGLQEPPHNLDAGNSGTTIRLLTGILSGQKFSTIISGDESLNRRPMKRIIEPLTMMGAKIQSAEKSTENFTAPLTISPTEKLTAITYQLPIASAQVKSAIIFAALYAEDKTQIIEKIPSRNHTEQMLGLDVRIKNQEKIITVVGKQESTAQQFFIPGDISSAAFFIVAALIIPNSEICIRNVGLNSTRTAFLEILKKMGGNIIIENERIIGGENVGDVIVKYSSLKTNIIIEKEIIPNIIDEIPILAVASVFSQGTFEVRNAQDLRNKESDRIHALCENLRKMGIECEEFDDGFIIEGKENLHSATFESYGDHRIAMAFAVAALNLPKESIIKDAECINVSYPQFWETLKILKR